MSSWCLTECRAITGGPKHHYFGYYDKCPYDVSGRYTLALAVDFVDRPPSPDDRASVCVIDLERDGETEVVAETQAFNWQQGAHLQWLPGGNGRSIIYNVREGDGYASCIHDLDSGDRRLLPRPIYTLSRDGTRALSLNFSRLHDCRPGYGYNGIPDPWAAEAHPADDGIYVMDLAGGESEMLVSLAQIAAFEPDQSMRDGKHWFNHLQFATDDTRFVFFHRWHARGKRTLSWARIRRALSPASLGKTVTKLRREGTRSRYTRMYTANPDGSGMYLLNRDEMTSHFDWFDGSHILAWARRFGDGDHYYLFTDQSQDVVIVGEDVLDCDGHCSYSPDRRFVITDTYPQGPEHQRILILYDPSSGRRVDIGGFYSPPDIQGEIRCDLHPRWNRDGTKVCFDSVHEGMRQVYEIDVAEFVKP